MLTLGGKNLTPATGPTSNSDDEDGCGESSDSSVLPRSTSESSHQSDSQSHSELPGDIAKDKTCSPVQPKAIRFPSTSYGNSGNRSFQDRWYHQYSWIEYSVEDAIFCFPC